MTATALGKLRGAHTPRVLRFAPSPIAFPKPKENFDEAPKSACQGACAPHTNAISAPGLSQP